MAKTDNVLWDCLKLINVPYNLVQLYSIDHHFFVDKYVNMVPVYHPNMNVIIIIIHSHIYYTDITLKVTHMHAR